MTTMETRPPEKAPTSPTRARGWWVFGGIATGVVLLMSLVSAVDAIWSATAPEHRDDGSAVFGAPVAGLLLDIEVGQVDLVASTGPDLDMRRESVWQGDELEVEEQWSDGTFTARADCTTGSWFRPGPGSCSVDYTIGVPSGAAAEVGSERGNVSVSGLDGVVDLWTGMGDIDAVDLRSTATTVTTGAGDVNLSFDTVQSDVDVTSTIGSIVIAVPDDGTTYHVAIDSGLGDSAVDIETIAAEAADSVITVATHVGDVEIRYAS